MKPRVDEAKHVAWELTEGNRSGNSQARVLFVWKILQAPYLKVSTQVRRPLTSESAQLPSEV